MTNLGKNDAQEDGLQQHGQYALDTHQPRRQPAIPNGMRPIACHHIDSQEKEEEDGAAGQQQISGALPLQDLRWLRP